MVKENLAHLDKIPSPEPLGHLKGIKVPSIVLRLLSLQVAAFPLSKRLYFPQNKHAQDPTSG